jgi:hypothetical protein
MKTTINTYLLIFLILSTYPPQGKVSAQSNSIEDIVTAPNAMFVELLGRGIALTAIYERMLFATIPHNVSLRAGFGFWGSWGKSGFVVPVEASYLLGSNHKLELGIGYCFITGRGGGKFSNGAFTALIGYRYQPIDGGFLIRVGFTPLFTANKFEPWVGLSLGGAF